MPRIVLPPFDARTAKGLLLVKKLTGGWAAKPKEDKSRAFLALHFRGVPNDPHRQILREIWPGVRPGPRRKPSDTSD